MIVISQNSKLFEVDNELFEEVKNFLKNLSKKKKKSFSYIDEFGDKIVVIGDKEYVIPTREDIEAVEIKNDFLDEEEVKKLINV